jgi:hypothetical protein
LAIVAEVVVFGIVLVLNLGSGASPAARGTARHAGGPACCGVGSSRRHLNQVGCHAVVTLR